MRRAVIMSNKAMRRGIVPAVLLIIGVAAGAAAAAAAGNADTTPGPAPRAERHSPRDGYPSLGPRDAPITLVFFTDYQCPVCPRAARELDRLVADFDGRLRIEIHHNPLAMHHDAFNAATAAKAAQRQGKFWEYHDALLATRSLDRDALIATAAGLGLDRATFVRDFDDAEVRRQVTAEAQQANDVKALGTPGFLVNGHVEVGWASLSWLEQVIRTHAP